MSEIPTTARLLVRGRDGGQCVRCSGGATDLHHRRRRRDAGENAHSPGNLISMCRVCHAWVHANPRASWKKGWIVPTWRDPLLTPMCHIIYKWVRLNDDGTFRLLEECRNCGLPEVVSKNGWCADCLILEGEAGEADLAKLRDEADHENA